MKTKILILLLLFSLTGSSQGWWNAVPTSISYTGAAYEDNGGISFGADASVDVNYPVAVSENEILIIQVGDADNDAFSTPAGWTLIYQEATNANWTVAYFWMRANGDEEGFVTVTGSLVSGSGVYGVMSSYSGCVTTGTPYESSGGVAVTQTTSPVIPAMTPVSTQRLAVGLVSVEDNITLTGLTDYTQSFQVLSADGSDANLGGFYYELLTATDSPSETLTLATSEYTGVCYLLLIPE